MNIKQMLIAGTAVLLFCHSANAEDKKPASGKKLLDPANMDKAVRPGDNFFMYANGAWLKQNPIPGSETRWGSFNLLQENNYSSLKNILESSANNLSGDPSSASYKIGAFYKSGLDQKSIDEAGLTPLKSMLDRVENISDRAGFLTEIGILHTLGLEPLFSFYVAPDDKNVTKYIPQAFQGGLGLPDRDYYFKEDARFTNIRAAYLKYVTKMLQLMGDSDPSGNADKIFALEKSLAEASMTRVEMRDPYKVYNKFDVDGATDATGDLNWKNIFASLGIRSNGDASPKAKSQGRGNVDSLILGQPAFFKRISSELSSTPITTWKKYLAFHIVDEMAPFLSTKFDELKFDFYGKTVRGQTEQKPRWKRVLTVVDGSIGELLGQEYVNKYFKPEAKARMLTLVNNLQTTYADRINRLDWMSDETKSRALTKLNTFVKKIGYPDKWKNYSILMIAPDSYAANVLAAGAFEYNYNLNKLSRPVDKTEWGMTPPTVNAYYNPAFNEIVFPAGILQYPFFDFSADDAVNYGGIGAVIGHEMTHGFDDQGRQYDADGNLADWWNESDARQFEQKAGVVVSQFNNYVVLDTVHVNGELTLGENLADLGGLAIAYEAFKKTKQGQKSDKIDGFNADQRFFLSWAQVWRANTRPEEMMTRIMTDPHSPNEWRCNGPLSNMQEFYDAFAIKPGDKMYRPLEERAKVW